MTEPIFTLDKVHFSYSPERRVLSGVDFRLNPGERIGIVGSNGCGKTTFLRLLVGLLKPTLGSVHAFGKLRARESDFHEVRLRAGFVFQHANDQLFCPTVIEDVAFGPLNLGKSRTEAAKVAREMLTQLGLAGFEDRVTYNLSGGEKRLVALATVLAMEPEVLLLDEPTAGLDDASLEQVTKILSTLPHAMAVVSHDSEFLAGVTKQRLTFKDGRLC